VTLLESIRQLRKCRRKDRRLNELRLANPLTTGVVEEHRIAVGFPDRGEFDASGSMEAKEYAAGPRTADEDAFCNLECSDFEFVLLANCLMNE
jgi:hypothetical protein